MLSPTNVAALLERNPISDREPWSANDFRNVERFYRDIVKDCERRHPGLKSRNEFGSYGSGYASFFDAWFYIESAPFQGTSHKGRHKAHYVGVFVLFSILRARPG